MRDTRRVGNIGRVMRHHDGSDAAPGYCVKHQCAHTLAQRHIEFGKRLIEHQSLRLREQGARQGSACALTARSGRRISMGETGQLHFIERLRHLCLARRLRPGG